MVSNIVSFHNDEKYILVFKVQEQIQCLGTVVLNMEKAQAENVMWQ